MRSTYLGIAVLALVAVGLVVYAFSTAGSPWERRGKKFDAERVTAMRSLVTAVDGFYDINNRLPATLEEVSDSTTGFYLPTYMDRYKNDPETGKPFEYIPGTTSFQICGVFSTDYDKEDKSSGNYYQNNKIEYTKGRYCYSHTVRATM